MLVRLTPRFCSGEIEMPPCPAVVLPRPDLPFPVSLPEFQRLFRDDTDCAAYLEVIRWRDGFRLLDGEANRADPAASSAGRTFSGAANISGITR